MNKIVYGGRHTTRGTVPARRGDIGEDASDKRSPGQVRFSSPCKTTRPLNFSTGGGNGDKRRQSRWRIATPTDRRIVAHNFLILTLGPQTVSHGRDVEKPKGIEQLESVARGRISRSGCKARSRRSSRPRHPMGDCVVQEGGFPLRFSSSRRGLRSFTSLHIHTHRMWGSIGSRGKAADRGLRGGGGNRTRSQVLTAAVRVRVHAIMRTRCVDLDFLGQLEAAQTPCLVASNA